MVDAKFKEAVAQRNLSAVRDMLKNRLLADHDIIGGLFSECWAECERAGIAESLYQPHDGRTLSDKASESNFNTLMGQLATNFSRERLDYALRVAKAVWADEQSSPARTARPAQDADEHSATGRVVGKRIVSERELGTSDEADSGRYSSDRGRSFRSEDKGNNPGIGIVIAAAVVVAVVLIITRGCTK